MNQRKFASKLLALLPRRSPRPRPVRVYIYDERYVRVEMQRLMGLLVRRVFGVDSDAVGSVVQGRV